MKINKVLSLLLCVLMITATLLAGCAWSEQKEIENGVTIIDNAGREVTVPTDAKRIAAMTGPSYEMLFMLGAADRIAMVKAGHTTDYPVALMLNPDLANIVTVGANPNTSVNIEDYLKNNVDLVLYYANDNELKKFETANIPVVAVSSGGGGSTETDDTYTSKKTVEYIKNMTVKEYVDDKCLNIKNIAMILGEEAMAKYEKWYQYNLDVAEKLYERTKDLKDEDRPTVYWANTWGENVLATCDITNHYYDVMIAGGTFYGPMTSGGNFPEITAEQLYDWDPDVIIVDNHGNYPELVIKSMQKETSQWASLSAVKNNQLYRVPTGVFFVDRGTSHALLILWMATFLQPELFEDIDIIEEIKYYYSEFYEYELTDDEAQKILEGWYENRSV